mgnify:CR=1 FL=1
MAHTGHEIGGGYSTPCQSLSSALWASIGIVWAYWVQSRIPAGRVILGFDYGGDNF